MLSIKVKYYIYIYICTYAHVCNTDVVHFVRNFVTRRFGVDKFHKKTTAFISSQDDRHFCSCNVYFFYLRKRIGTKVTKVLCSSTTNIILWTRVYLYIYIRYYKKKNTRYVLDGYKEILLHLKGILQTITFDSANISQTTITLISEEIVSYMYIYVLLC